MKNKRVNIDARGNSLSGQLVGWNARTSDVLRLGATVYKVVDSYPNSVRLRRRTKFGDDVVTRTYEELSASRARFL